jgi:hypothetical protein
MTLKKYLKQVADLFDEEKRKCEKERRCLEDALKKLKAREKRLEARLDKEDSGHASKKLKNELKVVAAQRQKGIKLLKKLESK